MGNCLILGAFLLVILSAGCTDSDSSPVETLEDEIPESGYEVLFAYNLYYIDIYRDKGSKGLTDSQVDLSLEENYNRHNNKYVMFRGYVDEVTDRGEDYYLGISVPPNVTLIFLNKFFVNNPQYSEYTEEVNTYMNEISTDQNYENYGRLSLNFEFSKTDESKQILTSLEEGSLVEVTARFHPKDAFDAQHIRDMWLETHLYEGIQVRPAN
jgi:hypothetical protein